MTMKKRKFIKEADIPLGHECQHFACISITLDCMSSDLSAMQLIMSTVCWTWQVVSAHAQEEKSLRGDALITPLFVISLFPHIGTITVVCVLVCTGPCPQAAPEWVDLGWQEQEVWV